MSSPNPRWWEKKEMLTIRPLFSVCVWEAEKQPVFCLCGLACGWLPGRRMQWEGVIILVASSGRGEPETSREANCSAHRWIFTFAGKAHAWQRKAGEREVERFVKCEAARRGVRAASCTQVCLFYLLNFIIMLHTSLGLPSVFAFLFGAIIVTLKSI